VLIDTTYWGRNFGVVVFKNRRTQRVLWRKFVRYETLADYRECIDWLEEHNFKIEGVVCDGMRGMFQILSQYRVQMCQCRQRVNNSRLQRVCSYELPVQLKHL